MDLSIIIVTWKSLAYLRLCLASIVRETRGITYELIVIDNASDDGAEESIRLEFPQVIFIQNSTNLGFARANNVGYCRSSGDVLAFLNPDTELLDNVFLEMVAHLRHSPGIGAAGARLLNTDGSLQTSCVQTFPTISNQLLDSAVLQRRFPRLRMWGMKALYSESKQPSTVDAISGACFVVTRTAFEQAGLFTETYFMYAEDLELSYKLKQAGYQIHFVPACRLVHHGSKSSERVGPNFETLQQKESILQFLRSTRGRNYGNCYRLAVALTAATRVSLLLGSALFGSRLFANGERQISLEKWLANFRWAMRAAPAGHTASS